LSENDNLVIAVSRDSSTASNVDGVGGDAYLLKVAPSQEMNFKESTDFDSSILPWVFVLILGVISILILQRKHYLRNYGLRNKKSEVEIIFTKAVSNKTQVHLVTVKGKELLLVESTKNIQCISLDSLQSTKDFGGLNKTDFSISNREN